MLIKDIAKKVKQEAAIKGWVFNMRSSGKIYFLQIRDGSGIIQGVVAKNEVPENVFQFCEKLTIESSVEITGLVKEEPRSPVGFELQIKNLKIIQIAEDYPISKKEHGTEFLMDHRHLWIRSSRQWAVLRIRNEVIWQLRRFFKEKDFCLTDTPILTPTSCEGTTTLFTTEYFGEKAYLSQSGQLYLEAMIYSLGRVYDFGPTFRAEKSKTRRHLTEFWMLDAEAAFVEHEENIKVQEEMICFVIQNVIKEKGKELELLGRDIEKLEKIKAPFYRLTYDGAIKKLKTLGSDIKWGDDLGADDETLLTKEFDKPVFITHYPAATKAFYMQPDPINSKVALCSDLLAPEGYGEIIGGSQRIDDFKLLEQRIKENNLPRKDFAWYLDLRKYGSVPHSGFGIGLERTVTWICGLDHLRETIPFPRLINRLRP